MSQPSSGPGASDAALPDVPTPDRTTPDPGEPDLDAHDPEAHDPEAPDRPDAEHTTPDPVLPEPTKSTSPRWSDRDRVRERELLVLLAELDLADPQRTAVRDELVTMHLPLAGFLARRFRDRGESIEDLTQVATIGLIKAVDRFDLERGVEFSTFASPTMVGEVKRHFRDKGWAIRVPRRLQELRISIGRATAELGQETGHSPTVSELAVHLGITDEEVLEGLESAQAYSTLSLDAGSSDTEDAGSALADSLGADDPAIGEVETRATLHPLVATLPPREQRIIALRFYENMTQAQIAEQVGVSQMHVSRLLAKSLAKLRSELVQPL